MPQQVVEIGIGIRESQLSQIEPKRYFIHRRGKLDRAAKKCGQIGVNFDAAMNQPNV